MTPLEANIVKSLVEQYQERGINVQQVLDNPMFSSLPLNSKLDAIQEYSDKLSHTHVNGKAIALNATKHAVAGAIGGVLMTNVLRFLGNDNLTTLTNAGKIGAVGAGLGVVGSLVQQYMANEQDRKTAKIIRTQSGLPALIDRSIYRRPMEIHPSREHNIPIIRTFAEGNQQWGVTSDTGQLYDYIKHMIMKKQG